MLSRLIPLLQLRRSTAFLLERADDRLLDDIGLSRAQLQAMHLGIDPVRTQAFTNAFPSGRALPVQARA
jgi:hypothetical protein